MTVLSAELIHVQGRPVLVLITDGGVCYVEEPKAEPLARGFVVVNGPGVEAGTIELEGGALPANPANGRMEPLVLPPCTTDPIAHSLACRLWLGELKEGPLVLPDFIEADAEQWGLSGEGMLVRK
jgi:hypothetical protein